MSGRGRPARVCRFDICHRWDAVGEQRAAARRGVRGEAGGEASGLVLPSSLATPGVSCGNAS